MIQWHQIHLQYLYSHHHYLQDSFFTAMYSVWWLFNTENPRSTWRWFSFGQHFFSEPWCKVGNTLTSVWTSSISVCIKEGIPSEFKRLYLNITASLKEISWLWATCPDSVLKVFPREQSQRWLLTYRMFMKVGMWDQLMQKEDKGSKIEQREKLSCDSVLSQPPGEFWNWDDPSELSPAKGCGLPMLTLISQPLEGQVTLGEALCFGRGIPKQGSQVTALFQLPFQQGRCEEWGTSPSFRGGEGSGWWTLQHPSQRKWWQLETWWSCSHW